MGSGLGGPVFCVGFWGFGVCSEFWGVKRLRIDKDHVTPRTPKP